MRVADVSRLAAGLDGVRERREDRLLRWHYQGRVVARQLDDTHIVVRVSFDVRDVLVHGQPATFSVPRRFAKHMMVVADLENGDRDAVEEAVMGAWRLQRGVEGDQPA